MTASANSNNAVDIKALVYALTKQRDTLPQPIQSSLQKIGKDFQQNEPAAADQLRDCIRSYEPLDVAYRDAVLELDKQYHSQERTKSLSATFVNSPGVNWFFVNEVIPAADWVTTVKQSINSPLLQLSHQKKKGVRSIDKMTSIGITLLGGICIGTWIAQKPGSIVGGIIGLAYGVWYEYSYKRSSKNSSSL